MSKTCISEEGYTLPSGKRLTREDACLIGREAGLNTSRICDDDLDYLNPEWITCPETRDNMLIHNNPVYRPFIYEKAPLPPTLQFYTSSPGLIPKSSYTINLKTLKPTSSSPNKNEIPEYILSKYK